MKLLKQWRGHKIYGVDREISNTCEDRFDEFGDEFNVWIMPLT